MQSLAIPRQAWKRIPSLAQNLQIFNTTSLQIKVIININFKQHIRLKSLVKGTQPKIHLSGKYLNSVNIVYTILDRFLFLETTTCNRDKTVSVVKMAL